MKIAAVLCLLMLAGCGATDELEPTRLTGPLALKDQEQRMLGCLDYLAKQRGTLVHSGGVEPRIAATVWNGLEPAAQERFIEAVACVGSAGQPEPRNVVLRRYLDGEVMIETQAANNTAF